MSNTYTKALVCELELMDYLLYTARDFGRLAVTEEHVISNYALTYALGRATAEVTPFPKSRVQLMPTYTTDLGALPFYVTPAIAVQTWTRTHTYNTIPEIYRERMKASYGRTFPSYGRYTLVGPESRYLFLVFASDGDLHVPRYVRLGKFKAAARVQVLKVFSVQKASAETFTTVPMHRNDLPSDAPVRLFNLILLGKGHAVLTDVVCSGDYWRLPQSRVEVFDGQTIFIGEGLPVAVHFCARGELP